MPQPRVLDLTPRYEQTPIMGAAAGFAKGLGEQQTAQRESDALKQIYQQYQQEGGGIEALMKNINMNPNIPNANKVKLIDQNIQMQKHNAELQKQAADKYNKAQSRDIAQERNALLREKQLQAHQEKMNKQQKEAVDEEKTVNELQAGGASDQEIELYKAASVGGKTAILQKTLDRLGRSAAPEGTIPEGIEDYDKGLTPAERVKRQDSRFTTQGPLVNKNNEIIGALESEARSIDLLNELNQSGKVGEGVHKLNINPKTGDLIIPQFANAEEQLFVKTVNDFTVKAKDSFGARVTNFELDRFMQRLPTLANSAGGRRLILNQMKLINEINSLEKRAVQEVFDQYGVRNIDYADAENIARRKIASQKEDLRKKYVSYEDLARKEDSELINNIQSKVKDGYTALRKPNGTIKQYPNKIISNLEDKGYKRL